MPGEKKRREKEKHFLLLSGWVFMFCHVSLYSMIKQTWKKRILGEKNKQYFLVNDHHMLTTKAYSKIFMILFF